MPCGLWPNRTARLLFLKASDALAEQEGLEEVDPTVDAGELSFAQERTRKRCATVNGPWTAAMRVATCPW
ncbi:MAG: hypothetical protein IPG10_20640 [Flavobacteriales bacterium]|nr:hypothetical protein [Flavobacteriales bacterium]